MEDLSSELIPGLPEEIAMECLTRLHYSAHRVSSRVCKRWRNLLLSNSFYYHRKQYGFTHKAACLVQALPPPTPTPTHVIVVQDDDDQLSLVVSSKPPSSDTATVMNTTTTTTTTGQQQPSRYGISMFDPVTNTWDHINPVPKYPDGLPLFCQVSSTEGKLVLMGGWNPTSWDPIRDVFVYDFKTQVWTQCADMPSTRSFFAVGAFQGKVFVAGGHDDSKNALNTCWVFDVDNNLWTQLPPMADHRDECEGIIIVQGSLAEFWVVSGYDTETQGVFKSSAEVYNIGLGQWRRVEDAWPRVSRCPRSCVGVIDDQMRISCWGESDSAVQIGTCGVDLGTTTTLVTGSAYQGAPHAFFLVQQNQGQGRHKLVKMSVPDEFSGFVQSGCCVEI